MSLELILGMIALFGMAAIEAMARMVAVNCFFVATRTPDLRADFQNLKRKRNLWDNGSCDSIGLGFKLGIRDNINDCDSSTPQTINYVGSA